MTARQYRSDVLAALAGHGFRPGPDSDPSAVYELLKSLYSFEIRGLRARHKEKERVLGPQPLDDYRAALHRLQDRYAVLRIPPWHWVERPPQGEPPESTA